MIEELVSRMFYVRNHAHLQHWAETSGYKHGVLGDFYDDLIDSVDSFVEAYQGKYGIIEDYSDDYELPTPALEYMISKADYIKESRKALPQDSELQNIIDEIVSLIDSTVYKLRFLK